MLFNLIHQRRQIAVGHKCLSNEITTKYIINVWMQTPWKCCSETLLRSSDKDKYTNHIYIDESPKNMGQHENRFSY